MNNLEKFKDLLEKDPELKFVYFKRLGPRFCGDVVDIPVSHVEMTIKNNPLWRLESSSEQMDRDVADLFKDDVEASPTLYEKDKSEVAKLEVPPLPDPVTKADTVTKDNTPSETLSVSITPLKPETGQMVPPTIKGAKNHRENCQCAVCKKIRAKYLRTQNGNKT